MLNNYLIYPCKAMRITQSYKGSTSHLPHTTGTPKDFPIDEGCRDTGRDLFYCPCNEMIVRRIYGTGTSGTNTLWLESTDKVDFADGTKDFFTMLITHPDDEDLNKLYVGQRFRRREKICREGKNGASAYHFHFSGGRGKFCGNGWQENSEGKFVLTVTGRAKKPEKLFFIDKNFTEVISASSLPFRFLPDYEKGKYIVTSEKLTVHTGPGTKYERVAYDNFRTAGKNQLRKLKGDSFKQDCFVKDMVLSISRLHCNWGKCPSGWVCLDYCRRKENV